jgi:glycosyltransferase involved in cell wall biosynthesis
VIEALPLIRKTIPHASLRILGSGPFESELRLLAERLGVDDVVIIDHIPPGDRRAMAQALAEAQAFAAFSDYEAHPVAVVEALTLGVPVVGYDIAGIADLVEDGIVRGVVPGAPASVAAGALVSVLVSHARAVPPQLPTWESAAAQLADIYRGACQGAEP